MDLGPQVEALANSRDDVVLRIIDIDTWKSPVAREHGISSIPHLVLYQDGVEVASGTGAVLQKLRR